ncbi:conserved protein of unknown function (plasmid) [Cupriavidus taiwanensis]|uniref:Uncharacterized protein n=1 Tax=Cupriavidus taiwanensis TaxID=164546 RepID=A0A375ITS0_9BURK|nr:hypothetical protein [Cupriavidus taiwanensis]SPK77490.1 conserved protein of unknown function [Cupriavidus taiwanensis]
MSAELPIAAAHPPGTPEHTSADAGTTSPAAAGLRPIERFNSDERLSRIVPQTDAGAVASYCSKFARDFLGAHLYFCSAKFTVARGGKVKALDDAFREAEAWFDAMMGSFTDRHQIEFALAYIDIPVKITHQFAGRLLRLVRKYDRLFAATLFCSAAGSVSSTEREEVMQLAAKRIAGIHLLCIPDNDKYAADGTRLPNNHELKD